MKRYRPVILVFAAWALGLAALPAAAQNMSIRGSVSPGSNGSGIVANMDAEWSDGGFDCQHGSPTLVVTATEGACNRRQVELFFEIVGGSGVTSFAHAFEYHVFCSAGTISHEIGWDATCSISGNPCTVPTDLGDDPPEPGDCPMGQGNCVVGPLTSINSGVFTFNLAGGDTIRITTSEGVPSFVYGAASTAIPALGEWGAIVVGGGIVALAVWLILRRRGTELS